MDITVSAADANRKFAELLRGVREGKTYTVTDHGRPVAKLAPVEARSKADKDAAKNERWRGFIEELRTRPAQNLPRVTRDEMNERD